MSTRVNLQKEILISILDTCRKNLEEQELDLEEIRDIAQDVREAVQEQAGIVVNIAQDEINKT